MTRRILWVGVVAAIAGLNSQAAAVDRVKIDSGELSGSVSGNVVSFKGVPFAAAPVGDNRWRAPQPVQPWKGVRAATEYAADCMQLPFPSDAAPLGTKPSEDCLYANVWLPVKHAGAKLPVMVWIYGGGFVNGGSSPAVYDGSHFAEKGIAFVSFNYRVGRFGFFAHPALTAESADGLLGNYAFMDQIAALRWIQKNIRAFGGDPGNVTVFGESAGGASVLMCLTSPMTKGLFAKAIIESGGGRRGLFPTPPVKRGTGPGPSGEAAGLAFAAQSGITGEDAAALAALRKLPADKVVGGLNMASMMMQSKTYSGPMIDGKVVVETPEEAFAGGRQHMVPLMAGANSNDIGFSFARTMEDLFTPFAADHEKAMAAYNPENLTDVRAVGTRVAMDRMMIEPARFVVRQMAAAGQPAYEYRFSYVAESMRDQWPGAPHATEIPFVFDTVAAKYEKKLAPGDEATAQAANAYWAEFAKTGNPNGTGWPAWPTYDAGRDVILDFTSKGPVAEKDAWQQRLDLTEGLATGSKGK